MGCLDAAIVTKQMTRMNGTERTASREKEKKTYIIFTGLIDVDKFVISVLLGAARELFNRAFLSLSPSMPLSFSLFTRFPRCFCVCVFCFRAAPLVWVPWHIVPLFINRLRSDGCVLTILCYLACIFNECLSWWVLISVWMRASSSLLLLSPVVVVTVQTKCTAARKIHETLSSENDEVRVYAPFEKKNSSGGSRRDRTLTDVYRFANIPQKRCSLFLVFPLTMPLCLPPCLPPLLLALHLQWTESFVWIKFHRDAESMVNCVFSIGK